MKKQPEITENTKQTFVNNFCELYSKKPIEKISIQEIANLSGYNRSTFYQYFADIYDLLDYVETDLLSYIKGELVKKEESADTVQDMLHCFEKDSHILALNALFGDYGSTRFLERLKREIPIDKWELNLPEGSITTPYLVEFYMSTAISLFRFWIRQQKDLTRDELFELVHNLYTGGVSSIINNF